MQELRTIGYSKWLAFFRNLQKELKTERDGTNATRLVFRPQTVKEKNGTETRTTVAKLVVNRSRKNDLRTTDEVILLDGTGSLELNRLAYGEEVQGHRYAAQRQGAVLQLTRGSCSNYALLKRDTAPRNRAKIARLIKALAAIHGDKLLVCCTMELERKLVEEGVLDGVRHLHFGEERGLNSAEDCEVALVIGREQPSVAAIEGMARAFMVEDAATFESVLDHDEEGELPEFKRRRPMRDGSEVWATVRSHPEPIVRAFLETIREAGVIQAADRVRAL